MMKFTLSLLFIILIFSSFKKENNTEVFSEKVINTILDDDFKKYKKYIVSKDDLFQLVDDKSDLSEEEKIEEKKNIEEIYEERIYKKIVDAFHEIKAEFSRLGINKKGVEIVNIDVEEKKVQWITKLDIIVTFKQNDKTTYTIKLDDCVMTKNGLKLLDNPIF